MKKQIGFNVILPLLAGIAIYLFFRKPVTYFHQWMGINLMLNSPNVSGSIIWKWVCSSFPDFLWLYALLHSVRIIWNNSLKAQMYVWLVSNCALAFASEIMQRFGRIPGTFDNGDLLAYALAAILFFIQLNKSHYSNQLNLFHYEKS